MTAIAAVKPSRKIALSLCETHSHGPLSYLEMGRADGPCVVFLHGFGADLLTWQLCLVPLASKYRVIALDLPGHGRTTTDVGEANLAFMTRWLDEAFDVLNIRNADVVAHSMGAKIALSYTTQYSERVRSLSLISPAGLGGDFHLDTLDAFLNDTGHADRMARQLLGPKGENLIPVLARSLRDATAHPDRNHAMKRLLAQAKSYGMALSPEGFDWSAIRVPVMILWGGSDRLIPLPAAYRLPPRCTLHVLDDIGHLPHMEASVAVVSALKAFLS